MSTITAFLISVFDLINIFIAPVLIISIAFTCRDILYRMKHSREEFIAHCGKFPNTLTNGGKGNIVWAIVALLLIASSTCWYIEYIPSGIHSLIAVVERDSEYYSLPAEVDVYNRNGKYANEYKLLRLFWPDGEVCYFRENELSLDEFSSAECCCSDVIDGRPDEEYEIKLTREHIYNPYVVESYDDKPIFSLLLFYFQAFFIAYCVYMSKQYERIRPKE